VVGKKDELLQGLDLEALQRIARSVSSSPIKSGTSKVELLKIVKESLSTQEIKDKLKQVQGGAKFKLTGYDLKAGGIGQVFLAVFGALNTLAYFVLLMTGGTIDYYRNLAPWGLIGSILLLVFAILLRVSIAKITWKVGGSRIGTLTSLFAYIAAIIGIVYYVLTLLGITTIATFGSSSLNLLGYLLVLSYTILIGMTMALLGVFFLLYREYSPSRELWMAGGIIYIIAGASEFSLTTSLYIPTAPFVAGIIGAACFLAKEALK
jgi:hypothetical protein